MATLFKVIQFFNNDGSVLSGGRVYWYDAGTSTPKVTWKNEDESTPHTLAYITLEADGRPPGGAIFIRGSYKLVIKTADGGTTLQTIDYINEYDQFDFTGLTATIADLNSTTTTAVSITGTYNVVVGDRGKTLMCNASTGNVTVNLLAAVTAGNKFKIWIKKVDNSTNTVTIVPSGIQTIDGSANKTLYDYNDFCELHCDGSNWKVGGSLWRGTVSTVTTSQSPILSDIGKLYNCNTTSGSIVITLPACATVGRGYSLAFKKTDSSANEVQINPNGSETIDGKSKYFLPVHNHYVMIKTDGANWFIMDESGSEIEAVTGDTKESYQTNQPGWILMNDGTIGNAASGGTTRANDDTGDLFILWWNTISDTYAPIYDHTGAKVPRGINASTDFAANRRIGIPRMAGRSSVNVGSPNTAGINTFVSGQYFGEEVHKQKVPDELGKHSHPYKKYGELVNAEGRYGSHWVDTSDANTTDTGEGKGFNIFHPVGCIPRLVKL